MTLPTMDHALGNSKIPIADDMKWADPVAETELRALSQ